MSKPNLKQKPLQWEAYHVNIIARTVPKHIPAHLNPPNFMPPGMEFLAQSDHFLSMFRDAHREVTKLQSDLYDFANLKKVTDAFDKKWLALSPAERQKHYFSAMEATCAHPDLEEKRMWCPEVTLEEFQKNNGKGYLQLLDQLLAKDQDYLQHRWINIKNDSINKLLRIPANLDTTDRPPKDPSLVFNVDIVLRRMLFITLVVWQTLRSFYGSTENLIPVKSANTKDTDIPQSLRQMESFDQIVDESKQNRKNATWKCSYCDKVESMSDTPFLCCSKCNQIGRKTKYCSGECQLNHWKDKKAPHKRECGILLKDVESVAPPLPDSGSKTWRHSSALKHLIEMLEGNKQMDYVFMLPAPKPDAGVMLQDPMGKTMFRIARKKAFETGDIVSVGIMYRFLRESVKNFTHMGYHTEDLIRQMKAEFGVDPVYAEGLKPKETDKLTEDQVKEALDQLSMDMGEFDDRLPRAGGKKKNKK